MKAACLVCIGFFLGLGLGVLLTPQRSLPGPEPASNDLAPMESEAKRVSVATPEPPDAARSLHAALAALPRPGKETGDGVITGGARTEDGKPLAGVRVRVVRNADRLEAPRGGLVTAEDLDLEKKVLELVERHRLLLAASFEARTDETGLFRLDGLRAGSYAVKASFDGYRLEPAPREDPREVQTGSAIHFIAKAEVRLPVTVLLPDGRPAVTAAIDCMRKSPSWKSFRLDWSRNEPEVTLGPGWYQLGAVQGSNDEFRSEPVEVGIKPAVAPSPITFQLEARRGIRGRVIFPPGEELDSIPVFALRSTPGGQPGYRDFLGGGKTREARKVEGFVYSFQDLPSGSYYLGAGRVREGVELVEEVQVKDRMVEKDLALPNLDSAEYVVLWVFGPGREILTDVQLMSGCHTENSTAAGDASPIRRPDGSFWIVHHRGQGCPRDDPNLRYSITVTSYQYGTRVVEYGLPLSEALSVEFTEPAILEVQITGYEGSGSEGWIDVDLFPKSEERGSESYRAPLHGEMDLRGRKKFGPLEPGPYELSIMIKTQVGPGGHSGTGISRIPLTLQPGKNVQAIPMPGLYSLTVLAEGLEPDTRIDLRQLAADGSGYTGYQLNGGRLGKGRITFERIPAGPYKVLAWSGGKQTEMVVRVQESCEVRYQPKPLDAMYVIVSDPSGYLARANFRTGDLIVGMEGTTFQDQTQMEALLKGAMIREEILVRILREGREIELPFDPRLQRNYKELGGTLWPSSR